MSLSFLSPPSLGCKGCFPRPRGSRARVRWQSGTPTRRLAGVGQREPSVRPAGEVKWAGVCRRGGGQAQCGREQRRPRLQEGQASQGAVSPPGSGASAWAGAAGSPCTQLCLLAGGALFRLHPAAAGPPESGSAGPLGAEWTSGRPPAMWTRPPPHPARLPLSLELVAHVLRVWLGTSRGA